MLRLVDCQHIESLSSSPPGAAWLVPSSPPPHPDAHPVCITMERGVGREGNAVPAPERLTWLARLRASLQRWVRLIANALAAPPGRRDRRPL